MVLNFLYFCFSEKVFISPSILDEILARCSNLGCRFFPFSTLYTSCHSILACRVSAEGSAVKHMGFPLYATCCFSLAAFNILSLCLVFEEVIVENFPNMEKEVVNQVQEAQRVPYRINQRRNTPKPDTNQTNKDEAQRKSIKSSKGKATRNIKGKPYTFNS